ncbi:MAG: hypothetical protein ABF288_12250 [Octadecabacter sp.]
MKTYVCETGYKITKFGRHVVSCAQGALRIGGLVTLAPLAVAAPIGFGAAYADGLPNDVALTSNISGDIDGALGGGYLISDDGRFGGSSAITVGTADGQSLVHNFNTHGGAGSGGGAGLGGVFFVDSGATLTLINTDFKSNRVQGGEGGSGGALRFYDRTTIVNGATVVSPSVLVVGDVTSMAYVDGQYQFDSIGIDTETAKLLQEDAGVSFGAYDAVSSIGTVSSNRVDFDAPVRIAADKVVGLTGSDVNISGNELVVNYTNGSPADLDQIVQGSKLIAGNGARDALQSGSVRSVEYFTSAEAATEETRLGLTDGSLVGKIRAIRLEDPISNPSAFTNFDFLGAANFDAGQFYTQVVDGVQHITPTNTSGTFRAGMTVVWSEIVDAETRAIEEKSATIASVSEDGLSFVLDTPLPADVFGFEAVENPMVTPNSVRIAGASGQFRDGQRIYIPGDEESGAVAFEGTIYSISGDDVVTITPAGGSTGDLEDFYEASVGLAIRTSSAAVTGGGTSLVLNVDTTALSGESANDRDARIRSMFDGRVIEGADFGDGTTVTVGAIDAASGTVTLTLSAAIATDAPVAYFKLFDPLSTGGSMNGLALPTNSQGEDGENGYSANGVSSFFNDGEGVDGTNGGSAGEPDVGAGYTGGDGGNGSDGQPVNAWLIYDMVAATAGLTTASLDMALAAMDMVEAAAPDPVAGLAVPLPDPVAITKASMGIAKSAIDLGVAVSDLTLAAANLGFWASQLNDGLAGLGGAGGDAGEASGGADFFGGGEGGIGGDGGDGALSQSDGGDGGEGGRGGDGGFGAGGGQGGEGGSAGANGNAADGDAGEGGFAGFGAGDGATGNGQFGGGGSGLGGALFVREGGNIVMTGNSVFELNYVAGGTTTSEFGEAGMAAGTDLFMMKGANVRLLPGMDNEIRFEGDIADDSLATNDGFQNAAGDGAGITIAGDGGLVIFNGENTYSGNTILEGASLTALMGLGVNDASVLRFNGSGTTALDPNGGTLARATAGSFLLQEDYVRRAGTEASETMWTGSGGFASSLTEGVTVNLGLLDEAAKRGQELTWGEDGFFVAGDANGSGSNGALTFGSELTVGAVEFTNSVDMNGLGGRVAVYDTGTFGSSQATLSGDWSNGGLLIGDAAPASTYNGTLFMTGQNTLSSLIVAGGTVSTFAGEENAGRVFAADAAVVVGANSALHTFEDEVAASATVDTTGKWALLGGLETTGAVTNAGAWVIAGSHNEVWDSAGDVVDVMANVASDYNLHYIADDFDGWNGIAKVGGLLSNSGDLEQYGRLEVAGDMTNSGDWISLANGTVGGDLTNSGSAVLLSDIETVDGQFLNTGSWSQIGNANVVGAYTNEGFVLMNGDLTVAATIANNAAGRYSQNGDVTATQTISNDGTWRMLSDGAVTAASVLGNGTFCLESFAETGTACAAGEATEMTLTLTQDGTFDGVFAGSGDLTKLGVGAMTLTADQTFTGTLAVNAGSVTQNATMDDDLDIVVGAAGAYTAVVSDSVASLTNSGSVDVDVDLRTTGLMHNEAGGTLNSGNLFTTDGNVQNDGAITFSGDQSMTIGTGSQAGLTGAATGSIKLSDGQDLTLTQSGDTTYAGTLERTDTATTATFSKLGSGILTLAGAVDVLTLKIVEGALAFSGEDLMNNNANVDVSFGASMILSLGDQYINQLSGAGLVDLGANDLFIRDGGDFTGVVNGEGVIDVAGGDFRVAGILTSPNAEFVVNGGATTTVSTTGSLDLNTMDVAGTLMLGGDGAVVKAERMSVTGTLAGSGFINSRTVISNGGFLRPGASPGEQTIDDLLFEDGSRTEIEIDLAGASAVAGVDYDRLNISAGGAFAIEDGAGLELVENGASALGVTTQVFAFDDFASVGSFGTVTSTATNASMLNLSTGRVVGLGDRSLSDLSALATTSDDEALLSGLFMGDTGGVAQFYGGAFIENLTQTWANNGDTAEVFRLASPEAYAGLGASAQAAAVNVMPEWVSGFAGQSGQQHGFFTASSGDYASRDDLRDNVGYGVDVTTTSTGFGWSLDRSTVLVSFGTVSSGLDSDLLSGSGSGHHVGVTVLGELGGSQGAIWTAGLRYATVDQDGMRASNNGSVSFADVTSDAVQINLGAEYNTRSNNADMALRTNLVWGNASTEAFAETANGANTLDVMAVDAASSDYSRLELGAKVGFDVGAQTQLLGGLDASIPLNVGSSVGASYDMGQGAFSVDSVGLDRASLSVSFGVSHAFTERSDLSLTVGSDTSWDGDSDVNAGLNATFSF